MQLDRAREGLGFYITTNARKICCGHPVVDAHHALVDDRAFIELGRDVMRCRADQLDAAIVRLLIGAGTLEAGKKAVV